MADENDFEAARLSEWTGLCAHADFLGTSSPSRGDRFDFFAQYEKTVVMGDGTRKRFGCSQNKAGREVRVSGLQAGRAAFVEVVEIRDGAAHATPLVFLLGELPAPVFVSSALLEGEAVVFLAQHGDGTSVLTPSRAIYFFKALPAGWVAVKDAYARASKDSVMFESKDGHGWKSVVSFDGLNSPASVEKLFSGLRTATASFEKKSPSGIVFDYFGAPADKEIYGQVLARPGITFGEVSSATGLNRYLCRAMLRRLYLEGKVVPRGRGFWPVLKGERQKPPEHASDFYKSAAVTHAQRVPAEAHQQKPWYGHSRSLDDLAEYCYRLSQQQADLARKVNAIGAGAADWQGPAKQQPEELANLKLHMARIDAELSNAWNRLDQIEHGLELNLKAMREQMNWAQEKAARLSWAHAQLKDKAQRTMKDFEPKNLRGRKRRRVLKLVRRAKTKANWVASGERRK